MRLSTNHSLCSAVHVIHCAGEAPARPQCSAFVYIVINIIIQQCSSPIHLKQIGDNSFKWCVCTHRSVSAPLTQHSWYSSLRAARANLRKLYEKTERENERTESENRQNMKQFSLVMFTLIGHFETLFTGKRRKISTESNRRTNVRSHTVYSAMVAQSGHPLPLPSHFYFHRTSTSTDLPLFHRCHAYAQTQLPACTCIPYRQPAENMLLQSEGKF